MSQRINLNTTPNQFMPILYFSQGDIGRTFEIALTSSDGYSIPIGATVEMVATKPSGFGFTVSGSLTGNVATFVTTETMTSEWGRFPAEIVIKNNGDVIGTANFYLNGERNPHPEGTIDGDASTIIPQLTLLVERVETAASSVLDRQTVTQTLPAGSQASYSFDEETNTQTFGIPQGEAGAGAVDVTASAYSSSKTYAVGDYVIHNDYLYRCTTAITTAEAWTSGHWTQVLLGDEVSDVKSDISVIGETKNLFNYATDFSGDSSLSSWITNNNDGTFTDILGGGVIECVNITLPAGTYTASIQACEGYDLGSRYIRRTGGSGSKYFTTFTLTSETLVELSVRTYGNNVKFTIQIEEGSVATEYVKYGHPYTAYDRIARSEVVKKADKAWLWDEISYTSGDGITNSSTIGSAITYNTGSSLWKHAKLSVSSLVDNQAKIVGSMIASGYDALFFLDASDKLLQKTTVTSDSSDYFEKIITEIPMGCTSIVWNYQTDKRIAEAYTIEYISIQDYVDEQIENMQIPTGYEGKTAVFFGTSIPEGTVSINGTSYSIATYMGHLLKMNVINLCKGSSCARRGWASRISDNDAYGWTGLPWQNIFYSLGSNLTEKQDLIDNYDTKWKELLGGNDKPSSLTTSIENLIKACSYENKLMPYLDGTYAMPDLFIFEHGFNDYSDTYGGMDDGIVEDESNLNRSKYADVMCFFFQKIWVANPQAKILIVSHYGNQTAKEQAIFNAQKGVANFHKVWFCDVADSIGWSQREITTTGYWDAQTHLWIESGGTSQTITRKNMAIYDGLHPHTDYSGNAVMREAEIIANYIKSNITL